ncbi:hypothetical protein DENSPDRAFT_743550, partial [Dentipellis sp. KUC8613]
VQTAVMIDCGATALFISRRFAQEHQMVQHRLGRDIALHNIDGSRNSAGNVTHYVRLTLTIGSYSD